MKNLKEMKLKYFLVLVLFNNYIKYKTEEYNNIYYI